jgi:hypothetical protein
MVYATGLFVKAFIVHSRRAIGGYACRMLVAALLAVASGWTIGAPTAGDFLFIARQ